LPCQIANPFSASRRGTVTATLDGGVSVYDTGYSVADQTLTASLKNPTRAQLVTLQYLVAYYGEINLCCDSGAFRALLSVSVSKNVCALSLRLISRLDA
jgi:hypothetical protein